MWATPAPETLREELVRFPGDLEGAISARGGRPRRRAMDLAIAATANVAGVPLLTHDDADFELIADLVQVRTP